MKLHKMNDWHSLVGCYRLNNSKCWAAWRMCLYIVLQISERMTSSPVVWVISSCECFLHWLLRTALAYILLQMT